MASLSRRDYALQELIMRVATRIFMPDLGAAQDRELTSNPFQDKDLAKVDPRHVLVEDNGAPVTIFAFSSSALLFSDHPTFEFRGFLKQVKRSCNLVFFRDVHRRAYHLTPDRKPEGLQFFENETRSLMKSLGARCHIAIGDSAGASAALYFGARCGMDKIIAFNPPFPFGTRLSPSAIFRTWLNLKALITNPRKYWEGISLGYATGTLHLVLLEEVGRKGLWDPIRAYREAEKRPRATVFFGEDCLPDTMIAHMLDGMPEVKLVPLPTWSHRSIACLAKRGELGTTIVGEILKAIGDHDARPVEAHASSGHKAVGESGTPHL